MSNLTKQKHFLPTINTNLGIWNWSNVSQNNRVHRNVRSRIYYLLTLSKLENFSDKWDYSLAQKTIFFIHKTTTVANTAMYDVINFETVVLTTVGF